MMRARGEEHDPTTHTLASKKNNHTCNNLDQDKGQNTTQSLLITHNRQEESRYTFKQKKKRIDNKVKTLSLPPSLPTLKQATIMMMQCSAESLSSSSPTLTHTIHTI